MNRRRILRKCSGVVLVRVTRKTLIVIAVIIVSLPYFATRVEAAFGGRDVSFGSFGEVAIGFNDVFDDSLRSVSLQRDGKIVVAGTVDSIFTVVRLTPDGRLDTGFSGDGIATVAEFLLPDFSERGTAGVAIQSNGKIVAIGTALNDITGRLTFALVRFNRNGKPDRSFGRGGEVITNFGDDFGGDAVATKVAIQSDGRIVVAGTVEKSKTNSDFLVARYTRNGNLDKSFGVGGKITTDFFGKRDSASDIALQPNDRVVVGGSAQRSSTNSDFALARYNSDGTLDTSFSRDGKQTTDFFGGSDDISGIAVQQDGRIVAVGSAATSGLDFTGALARYNRNGSLDNSFNEDGRQITDFSIHQRPELDVAIQKDGKIITAGFSEYRDSAEGGLPLALATVSRYNPDGSFDVGINDSFDGGCDFNIAKAIAIQPDGNIAIAATGDCSTGGFVVRYLSN